MRLEQVVLYGPGDDERVRFGSGVTVFAGLGAQERADLVATIVDALTGRLSNASVVYTDHSGEKVFSDRTGATFAATGTRAPGPSELLGKDPTAATRLLTVTADDLGLGRRVSAADLQGQLTEARSELERLQAEHADFMERTRVVATWREELLELDHRIEQSDADAARWAWVEKRRRLDEVRTELAMREETHDGRSDRQILQAVDALRSTGEVWADLAAAASELRQGLGPVPAVSAQDLARVAATPEALPPELPIRLDAWQAAVDTRMTADAQRAEALAPIDEPDDLLVAAFAAIDQDQLWSTHEALARTEATYADLASSLGRDGIDPEAEAEIEAAHLEVVHCQREVERRFVPGMLGAASLAVGALLGGHAISILLGIVMLLGSVAMGAWLIVAPRKNLAAANATEEAALRKTDADSWLGHHLRRLDEVDDLEAKQRFEAAATDRASAKVDWDELVGDLSVDDLASRADAIRAHADATNLKATARRRDLALAACASAAAEETRTRRELLRGLEDYGMSEGGATDLDPRQLASLLAHRVEAGHLARRAKRLQALEEREADAAHRLDDLLTHLGFTDGELESRLERAISAVNGARLRQSLASQARSSDAIRQEIDALDVDLRETERQDWTGVAEPTSAPSDPDLLEARRREIAELVAAAGTPDLVGAERRYELALARVNDLEARLEGLAQGPGSLQQRLISRLGRSTWLGDHEESIPVLVDEALISLPVAERLDILDLLVRLSKHTQVVVLTADPVVSRWARDRSTNQPVALYEADVDLDVSVPVT